MSENMVLVTLIIVLPYHLELSFIFLIKLVCWEYMLSMLIDILTHYKMSSI